MGKSEKISLVIHPILGKRIIPKLERNLENNKEIDLAYTFKTSREAMKDVLDGHSDFAIIADPLNYPELIVRNLWSEYIGLYSKDGKFKDKVFYNVNMIFLQKFLKQINFKLEKEINDYGLIADILNENNSMGFLPNPIAEQAKDLKLIKKFGNPIKVALVYRYDRRKSRIFTNAAKLIKKVSQEV